jgi:hypothetical protein
MFSTGVLPVVPQDAGFGNWGCALSERDGQCSLLNAVRHCSRTGCGGWIDYDKVANVTRYFYLALQMDNGSNMAVGAQGLVPTWSGLIAVDAPTCEGLLL